MESEARHQALHLAREIVAIPEAFDFFQAVRVLKRVLGAKADKAIEFKVERALNFPRASIVKVLETEEGRTRYQMFVTFIGLFGQSGILPQHYTELLLERIGAKDHNFTEFLDIFNQRIIELCYQIWASNRFYVGEDGRVDPKKGLMSFFRSLTGVSAKSAQGAQDMELYYSGLYSKHNRPSEGLRIMLEDYFDVPVKMSHYSGEWIKLDTKERSVLSYSQASAKNQIGMNCIMGSKVWLTQNGFDVIMGPVSYSQFQSLLPNGKMLPAVRKMIENFVGFEYRFNVKVLLRADDVPRCQLSHRDPSGSVRRLGWNSWLKTNRAPVDVVQVKLTNQPLFTSATPLIIKLDKNNNNNKNNQVKEELL